MNSYLKHILTIQQQLQSYIDAGMTISSPDEAERALKTIGYYRLRGYCFHLYDNTNKTYYPGTDFSDILHLCYFDTDLSHLLFKIITSIEISLRSHLIDALLIYNDALILFNPQHFTDKKLFWKNLTTLSGEIARSNDVFIQHHFQNSNPSAHNGLYQITLAMKYLSPNSDVWQNFISELEILFKKYQRVIELNRMNFPKDWKKHLTGFSRDL